MIFLLSRVVRPFLRHNGRVGKKMKNINEQVWSAVSRAHTSDKCATAHRSERWKVSLRFRKTDPIWIKFGEQSSRFSNKNAKALNSRAPPLSTALVFPLACLLASSFDGLFSRCSVGNMSRYRFRISRVQLFSCKHTHTFRRDSFFSCSTCNETTFVLFRSAYKKKKNWGTEIIAKQKKRPTKPQTNWMNWMNVHCALATLTALALTGWCLILFCRATITQPTEILLRFIFEII